MSGKNSSGKRKTKSSSSTSSIENSPVAKMAARNENKVSDTAQQFSKIMDTLDNLFKGDDFINAVSVIVEKIVCQLSDKFEHEVDKINTRLDETQSRLLNIETENEELRVELSCLKTELNKISEENNNIKLNMETVCRKNNDIEQYSRLESIRIHGIRETENENCKQKVCELFKEKLQIDIKPTDISKIHRLNQLHTREGKPRPIIMRFIAHYHKRHIIENRRKLKGSGYVITEDLTQVNFGVLNRAHNHESIESSWSVEGKLYAKLKTGQRIRIFAYETIDQSIHNALRRGQPRFTGANAEPIGSR